MFEIVGRDEDAWFEVDTDGVEHRLVDFGCDSVQEFYQCGSSGDKGWGDSGERVDVMEQGDGVDLSKVVI